MKLLDITCIGNCVLLLIVNFEQIYKYSIMGELQSTNNL